MKTIDQLNWEDIELGIDEGSGLVFLNQSDDNIVITKHGAKQLIEILKEFVGEECKRIAVDENGECLHFHTTFGRGECFDCGKKLKESTNEN